MRYINLHLHYITLHILYIIFYYIYYYILHFYHVRTHVYVFIFIFMICGICSSVISFFLICMCNVAISTVLMYCFVTLVRLSLVTNKGYLLTYLSALHYWNRLRAGYDSSGKFDGASHFSDPCTWTSARLLWYDYQRNCLSPLLPQC